ncbi:hypothetical protein VUJ46_11260 [Chryseobacterium sp. MYb264]|uniref:hypothetical protein n=1 Tax=Chryseobacterium sp. MYb264 TaxID=2745153 RepID=UPI002E12C0A8|nr:hypothetical protein VUJ46_11260 [Chryseobacterium sp. MYb264]
MPHESIRTTVWVYWRALIGGETTMFEYINQLPITSDEYHLTRYAISDGAWHISNTLIYSISGGITQEKKANSNIMANQPSSKEVIDTANQNDLFVFFNNYKDTQGEIHLVNFQMADLKK